MGTYSGTFPLTKLNRWRRDKEGGTGAWRSDSKASQGAYGPRGPYVGEITFSAPEGFDPVVYKATNVSMTVTRDSSVGRHGDTIDLYLYAGYIDPNEFYDDQLKDYEKRKISTQTIAKPASGTTTFTFSQTDLDRFNQYCLDAKSYRFMMWSGEAGFLSSSSGYTRNYTTIIDVKIVVTYTERAAQATASSYTVDLSQQNNNAILDFNNIGNNFTYKTIWALDTETLSQTYDSTKGDNTFSLTIPKNWAAQFTSSFSKKGTVKLETYNGSTRIGFFEYPVNYTIPSDYETQISLSLEDGVKHYLMKEGTDGEVSKEYVFLQNESSKKISFTYNNPYYSVISEPKIQFLSASGIPIRTLTASLKDQDNQNKPNVSYEILEEQFFSDIGKIKIICSIKDSRKGTLTFIDDYSLSVTALPDFSSLPNIQRAKVSGENYSAGTYLKIIGKLQNGKDGFKIIATSTEDIVEETLREQGAIEQQPEYYLTTKEVSADRAYDINFRIFSGTYYRETTEGDYLIEYESNLNLKLSSANYLLHFLSGGKAIGMGTAAQPPEGNEVGKITFGWPTQFFNPIEINSGGTGVNSIEGLKILIGNLMYPIGSIYMSTSSDNPSSLFGGTWEAWGSGRVPVGINSSDSNFNSVEKTGGSANAILVSHNHRPASYNATGSESGNYLFSTHLDWNTESVAQRRVDGGTSSDPYALTATAIGDLGQDSYTTTEGEDGTNKNLQPYITCYMWKRTA